MQEAYVAEISFAAKKQNTAFASGHKFSLLPVPKYEMKWMDEGIKRLFALCEGRANMWKGVHK